MTDKPYEIYRTEDGFLAVRTIKKSNEETKPLDFDINNDGVVDKKDISAMAKKLGKRGGRKKRKS